MAIEEIACYKITGSTDLWGCGGDTNCGNLFSSADQLIITEVEYFLRATASPLNYIEGRLRCSVNKGGSFTALQQREILVQDCPVVGYAGSSQMNIWLARFVFENPVALEPGSYWFPLRKPVTMAKDSSAVGRFATPWTPTMDIGLCDSGNITDRVHSSTAGYDPYATVVRGIRAFIKTLPATNVGGGSAVLHGEVAVKGFAVSSMEVGFEWSVVGRDDQNFTPTQQARPDTWDWDFLYSYRLDRLTPGTYYMFRACAEIEEEKVYGEWLYFVTLDEHRGLPLLAEDLIRSNWHEHGMP